MLKLERLDADAITPKRTTPSDAGLDLYSIITTIVPVGKSKLIFTGWKMAVPEGYEIQIRPRSGLALKKSITVGNSPGTVDSSYRGQVGVILINHGTSEFLVNKGDRIAQMVINKIELWEPEVVKELPNTIRGTGGFGSSGVV